MQSALAQPQPGLTVAALCGPHAGPLLAFLNGLQPPQGLCHALVAVNAADHKALLATLPGGLGQPRPSHWPDALPPGFHRLHLDSWVLTLCVGDVAKAVTQWRCAAHLLWVDAALMPVATGLSKTLARHCRRDAQVIAGQAPDQPQTHLPKDIATWQQAGFVVQGPRMLYQPRWPVSAPQPFTERQALVIGAGLAGAAACLSLTRRGWLVTLLDQASAPAGGASGLPVGMLSEHVTAQETVLSRLSRSGMPLHLRELQRLVPEGAGWQSSQVINLRNDDGTDSGCDDDLSQNPDPTGGLHANAPAPIQAAIVRPAALVNAWLAQAQATGRLSTRYNVSVAQLRQQPQAETAFGTATPAWQALDAQGQVLASAPHVVVAAAFGSAALMHGHGSNPSAQETLRPVKGQLSYGHLPSSSDPSSSPLAPHPVRDHGVYVPCFDDRSHPDALPHAHRFWAMGSTYERAVNNTHVTPQGHQRNAASLNAMLPDAHRLMAAQQANGTLMGWAQVRCASTDRLPLVGAMPGSGTITASMKLTQVPRLSGLWALCAMGSRGLTLSLLGAELLAAHMDHEPLPIESDLADALDPARFALKQSRKPIKTKLSA